MAVEAKRKLRGSWKESGEEQRVAAGVRKKRRETRNRSLRGRKPKKKLEGE